MCAIQVCSPSSTSTHLEGCANELRELCDQAGRRQCIAHAHEDGEPQQCVPGRRVVQAVLPGQGACEQQHAQGHQGSKYSRHLHVYMYVCVYACVCVCACVCMHVYVCECMCVCACECICVYACVYACVCMNACICVYTCVCMHVRVCVCIRV